MSVRAQPQHRELLAMINQFRAQHGQGALALDPALMAAADGYARDMADRDYFRGDHTTPEGATARQRILNEGYPATALTGENILYGQPTAAAAFATWRDSPPHRDNMLSPHYRAVGIAGPCDDAWSVAGDVFQVWVCDFGSVVTGEVGTTPAATRPDRERPARPVVSDRPPKEERQAARQAEREARRAERPKAPAPIRHRLHRVIRGRLPW